jgi:5-methylcytosine-specific restriction enzyme A
MLRVTKPHGQPSSGLAKLLAANCPHLTVEYLVLFPKFQGLFTDLELRTADRILSAFHIQAAQQAQNRERLYPEELPSGRESPEGSRKQIRVNAYERSQTARTECLRHHGYLCAVCGFAFERVYGDIGSGFMHVHYLRPLHLCEKNYKVDPIADLRPVCPNCHAMLHKPEPALAIEELRARIVLSAPRP